MKGFNIELPDIRVPDIEVPEKNDMEVPIALQWGSVIQPIEIRTF